MYEGIQPLKCYEQMWKDAGCTTSGWGKPREAALDDLRNLNVR